MKYLLVSIAFCFTYIMSFGQIQKDHTLSIKVDGKEFSGQPQNLKFGGYR